MRARDTDAIPLAPRPHARQYRKLAKELTAACRTGDADAIRAWAAGWMARLGQTRDGVGGRTPEGVIAGIVDAAVEASLEGRLSDAQLFLARLHGFRSWPRFVAHIESGQRPGSAVARFESAADAIVTGDLTALRRLLYARPGLVHERSTREHEATLLHYTAANGHEDFRQRTPPNAVAIARMLLEAGAEVDALARMYGWGCTTMEMLVSSTHPHAAGVQAELVETLVDFGAAVDGVHDNGSPLLTALRFRYPRAAEMLARRGARLDTVLAAAGLGRADLVDGFIVEGGRLRPDVPLADVPWPALPADPTVHVEHALTWACGYGHQDVVRVMLGKGVSPDARDGEATALHFAAAHGHLHPVQLLLEHGASLEARNSYGGTVLDGTLWYAFNDPTPGVDYAEVVRALLEAGAHTDVYPEMKSYVDAALAGRRGGGYPTQGEERSGS